MRQGIFVKINEEKWRSYEKKLIDPKKLSADDISRIYVHLTEDLAYARANYPKTQVETFLNEMTVKVHNLIYRNKPENVSRWSRYWRDEVPDLLKESYPQIGYSFLIFSIGIFIGFLSAANDDTFIRLILGDTYVNMTLENIEKGDPMAVYKGMSESTMFFAITVNNIRVALLAFAMGILFSVGTGYILLQNGIMLGAFHHLFFEHGLFDETILTIWIHGTLEISAIVIAGGAGLVMGNGILFPGTYPRITSFQRSARKGLKIVMSLVPFFIIAGFLESFITRKTDWPLSAKIVIISISFLMVLTYLVFLPNFKSYVRSPDKAL